MMTSCFSCVLEGKIYKKSLKKSLQESKKTRQDVSFSNLSNISDESKIRYICNEIEDLGKGNVTAEVFTYQELSVATQDFHHKNLIGKGGFGRVYKGYIERKNIDVAVKKLDRNGFQGNHEFLVEVLVLSDLHHPNIVNLLGYCAEGDHRILVYEYMPNGSLENHLLNISTVDEKSLDWETRLKITRGAAKGLEYLHEQANPPIIYRDFKASNILLDNDFNPKLSDFGLAKLGQIGDKAHVSTTVMGTSGYCAPEYVSTGQLSTKSDVYSFGIVLLEMITGRRVIDISRPTQEQNLLTWAGPLLKDKKKFHLMADPLLKGNYPEKAFNQALAVAAMCLQEEANIRPFIIDVVTALEYLSADKSHVKDDDNDDDDDDDDDNDDDRCNYNDNDHDGDYVSNDYNRVHGHFHDNYDDYRHHNDDKDGPLHSTSSFH